jgi:hypothetical protein
MMSEEAKDQAQAEEFEMPLPPPTFQWLVLSLSMQAEMHMGRIPTEPGEAPKANFKAAQHYIDMLGMVQEKTRGNLNLDEDLMLNNTLTELRFRFVQARQETGEK